MRIIVWSLVFVWLAATASADTPPPSAPVAAEPDAESLHQGLRRLKQVMEKAMNEGDIDTIIANVDEQVVFTTMNGDVARGRDAIRQYFQTMMQGPNKVVESVTTKFEPDSLSILHRSDMAIAYGHSNDQYVLANGQKFAINGRWSGTFLRTGDDWRVASFHYSANVFDNPILLEQRKWLLIIAAACAAVAALLGFLLGRRSKRAA
jgi:uncharacterized protein (TIGR02246 family)